MDFADTHYFLLIVPICLILMGGLFFICYFFFKAPAYLFWLGLGYVVPSFALAAQSFLSNDMLTLCAPCLGAMYLFGAWASAYAMALRKNANAHSKLAFVLIFSAVSFLTYYSLFNDQLWVRMLVLNLTIAIVESLVLFSIFKNYKQTDLLNKIVDYSYLLIVLYGFVRGLIIFIFLKNIEMHMLVTSVWWLMMLAASILSSLWFAIVLLGTLVRDIVAKLNDERSRDPLTHLLNRRGFYDAVKLKFSQSPQKKCFLVMCDVDHFKKINDTYGHSTGDQVLQQIGQMISKNIGENDLAGRFGGEEFIILIQVEQIEAAYNCVERVRIAIENEQFSAQKISLTASFGLTPLQQRNLLKSIDIADKLLYDAKRAGRNRTVLNQQKPRLASY